MKGTDTDSSGDGRLGVERNAGASQVHVHVRPAEHAWDQPAEEALMAAAEKYGAEANAWSMAQADPHLGIWLSPFTHEELANKLISLQAGGTVCGTPLEKYNVLVMSVGFLVLFSAYNTLQNYATSLFPHLGYLSLATLYLSVCVVVPLAPAIVARVGERAGMVGGGALYVVYLGSLIKAYEGVVLFTSVCIGAGAAVLWVAQGAFLTRCSTPSTRAHYAGVFWGIFQGCNVIGNATAYFVFAHTSSTTLFVVFTCTGAAGVLVLCFLRPIPPRLLPSPTPLAAAARPAPDEQQELLLSTADTSEPVPWVEDPLTVTSPKERVLAMLRMFDDGVMLLLLLPFFLTGFELAFWTGEFPPGVLSQDVIGLVLMWSGVGEVLGGLAWGYVSDSWLGPATTFSCAALMYIIALFLTLSLREQYFSPDPIIFDASWLAYCAALCYGMGDAGFNTQVYAVLGQFYPEKSVGAFTIFQLLQNFGSAAGYYYSPYLPLKDGNLAQIWIQTGVVLVSAASITAACRLQARRRVATHSPKQSAYSTFT